MAEKLTILLGFSSKREAGFPTAFVLACTLLQVLHFTI